MFHKGGVTMTNTAQPKYRYVITGVDRSGKRFKPIYTNTPQHYNIWKGTLWEILPDGKRRKIKEYYN